MTIKRFSIATFNTYNLVLPEVTFYENKKYTKAQYAAKKSWLQHQIEQMQPAIIGFQEIFHLAALKETLTEIPGFEHVNLFMSPETGSAPCVALATRFPLENPTVIEQFPAAAQLSIEDAPIPILRFQRPVVRATVKVDAASGPIDLSVFVVHLKSKRPLIDKGADPDDPLQIALGSAKSLMIRAAEATALRQILVETMRNNANPVVVMGDINDSVTAVTSEIIAGSPPYKRLSAAKKAAIWDVLLYNVKDLQSRVSYQDTYYTHIFNGYYESLDHIFVSNELVRSNPKSIGYMEYVKVLNDHLLDETLSNEDVPLTQSDHGQVVATIKLAQHPE